jgi:hypothetical protein
MIHRRGVALTESAAALAKRYDIVFVDMFNDQEIRRPGYWSADRLHLNADGHRRVASRILAALGHPTTAHAIEAAPIGARDVRAEARFYREHVLPWVRRRLQGNSSGDNLVAKHITWTPVTAT